jgi:hypothetical protein
MNQPTEDLFVKTATQILVEIFKSSLSGVSGFTTWVSHKGREYDPLNISAAKYAESFRRRHDLVRILGMDHPIPLRDIYVRVNIYEKVASRMNQPPGDLYRSYVTTGFKYRRIRQTQDALTAVNTLKKLVVLGAPGAGKTTFLKYVGLRALDGALNKRLIPVLISLKDWSDSRKNRSWRNSTFAIFRMLVRLSRERLRMVTFFYCWTALTR